MRSLIAVMALFLGLTASASEKPVAKIEFDRSTEAIHRGAEVVLNVCMGCHSLRYMRYQDLRFAGIAEPEITKLRGEHAPDDSLLSAMDDAAASESFGRIPPDQSTLAKAREGGANYIYSFVTSFALESDGSVVNRMKPETRMPDVLGYATSSGTDRAAIEGQIRDAAVFLEWASDPRAGERRTLGRYVIAYLILVTVLLYFVKRRVWKGIPS